MQNFEFSFPIAKINVFDCQKSILWQSKTSNLHSAIAILAIEHSLFGNCEQNTIEIKDHSRLPPILCVSDQMFLQTFFVLETSLFSIYYNVLLLVQSFWHCLVIVLKS